MSVLGGADKNIKRVSQLVEAAKKEGVSPNKASAEVAEQQPVIVTEQEEVAKGQEPKQEPQSQS